MAFPSLFEGFGFTLLEAMACGAQVVCSNTTSLGELAKDYAETFDPRDPEDILAAIVAALSHIEDQNRKERGLAYAATFDWEVTANEVLKVYQRCASKAFTEAVK
jgi:glycosyltransferase involved in cell wall biosynthesis